MANKEPALTLARKGDAAILTVRTFYLPIIEANGQNYDDFFNASFNQLIRENVQHLIIDLRNNHGGTDPVAMSLLSHLHDSLLYYYRKRSSILKPDAKHVKKNNVYEIIGRGPWTGKIRPARNIYKGKVYVLMNGYCVSAAAEFIGHLKNLNRAVFIGEETGGNPVIFTGGVSLPVELPHTRITGTIPLQLVEMNVSLKNSGHGVMPDYNVVPSIDDILHERDIQMEFALQLIHHPDKITIPSADR
jgi:C-terminal processing protease CtpA/Prc